MVHPAWLGAAWAVVTMAVGGYSLARLVVAVPLGRRTHVDLDAGHVLMTVAMVGMFVPGWRTLPDGAWEGTFLVVGLWCAGRAGLFLARGRPAIPGATPGPHLRHLAVHGVMAFAMVYMDAVSPAAGHAGGAPGMAMSSGAGVPSLTLLLVVVLLASAVWQLNGVDRLVAAPAVFAPSPVPVPAARAGAFPGGGAPAGASPGGAAPAGASPGGAGPVPTGGRPWLAPRLEVVCHVVMCLAMAFTLVLVV